MIIIRKNEKVRELFQYRDAETTNLPVRLSGLAGKFRETGKPCFQTLMSNLLPI